ncbi:CHAT domain-containing protein [Aporhodopirellula aestuarii]|uniref:CHAT domain-containing protein n=1 Tax=Aporhodopirellula aestuarii TaxID=2950107 RepID=A0ABT0U9M5_9BACT|nr:CHAT domain-containing tetratricopeptide repeat protein [Aporhodopirellula aestuarii]MCM2373476.1 CHAT domain-containing protein [Aporhodopirellula aestuarii]
MSTVRSIIILVGIFLSINVSAQVYVVTNDDAGFMDGPTRVADIKRDTEFYALEVRDEWLLAVEPKSLSRFWIAKSKAEQKTLTKAQLAEEAGLWQQMSQIEEFVNARSATTDQLQLTLDCTRKLRSFWDDKHPHAATAVQYAGIVAANAGAYAQAETLLNDALDVHSRLYGKAATQTAEICIDLANLSNHRHELKKAIQFARQAWNINRDALGAEHPDAISATLPLAHAMEQIQEYEDALKIYQTAHRVFRKSYGDTHLMTLKTNAKIAQQLVSLDRKKEAVSIYEAVVTNLEKHHPDQSETIALQRLRLTSAKLNSNDSESMEAFGRSIAELEKKFPNLVPYIRSQQRLLLASHLQAGQTQQAFAMVDSRLRQLRTTIRKELWGMNALEQREHLAQADSYTFFSSISLAVDFAHVPQVSDMSAEWLINGKGLVEEAQSVQGGATLDLKKREAWASQPWVTCDDIRGTLSDNEVFVDVLSYLDFEFDADATPSSTGQRYAAWILTNTGNARFIDLGPAEPIDNAVKDLTHGIGESVAQIRQHGEQTAYQQLIPQLTAASRLIWHPILKACDRKPDVLISPDQSLWLLPWSALLNPDGETFVAETHSIQLQLSGRDLIQSDVTASNKPGVIFADPNFDVELESTSPDQLRSADKLKSADGEPIKLRSVGRLAFSAVEAEMISPAISRITGNEPKTMMQDAALESKFKELTSPSVIVVSTHGFTFGSTDDGTNPLLKCGLLMAGANGNESIASLQNDGVLTGLEIAGTDLSGTRLAVLSACQTGLGELEATGGVVGLRRAFHIAGARSVLSSLWEIPDRDTMLLMQGFFDSLAESKDVASSLQTTQQRLIAARRERYGAAHPFFWAAFVMTGNSRLDL